MEAESAGERGGVCMQWLDNDTHPLTRVTPVLQIVEKKIPHRRVEVRRLVIEVARHPL